MKKSNSFLGRLKLISLGSAMADMALLLLVFFMATTSTEPPKGVEVDLPDAQTEGAEQDSLYISISNSGGIYFDGKKSSLQELKDDLMLRGGEIEKTVAITADKNLDYRTVRSVLDLLQEMDFLNIIFMSIPKESGNDRL